MSECIFCKIIQKEIPSAVIDENEHVLVIEDIKPKAPIHYLIIPKIHVADLGKVDDSDEHTVMMQEIVRMIRKLAKNLPEPKAFNLVVNNGAAAGQKVFHMHWHLMAGKNLYTAGLTL